ncbi:hypothetical protein ACFWWA_33410 [Streptomyces goshikiensis]|uniref:hypothetical protein n=1 Tax=Streptomyces goshikiensis TaxID=1942 RepID=UPI003668F457
MVARTVVYRAWGLTVEVVREGVVAMAGWRRRVGGSVLAGAALAVCGWCAHRCGHESAGRFLSLLAGAVTLAGAWLAHALDLSRAVPPVPDAAPWSDAASWLAASAREQADRERSLRLLRAIDQAADDGSGGSGELSEFEQIVFHGVAGLSGREYPPPGHSYPRP